MTEGSYEKGVLSEKFMMYLLEEGIVFESRPGRFKFLGDKFGNEEVIILE